MRGKLHVHRTQIGCCIACTKMVTCHSLVSCPPGLRPAHWVRSCCHESCCHGSILNSFSRVSCGINSVVSVRSREQFRLNGKLTIVGSEHTDETLLQVPPCLSLKSGESQPLPQSDAFACCDALVFWRYALISRL